MLPHGSIPTTRKDNYYDTDNLTESVHSPCSDCNPDYSWCVRSDFNEIRKWEDTMKLSELKALCVKMEQAGYEDSDIRVLQKAHYNAIEITLTPNEYGDIVIGSISRAKS
jgi:hypothetical protein